MTLVNLYGFKKSTMPLEVPTIEEIRMITEDYRKEQEKIKSEEFKREYLLFRDKVIETIHKTAKEGKYNCFVYNVPSTYYSYIKKDFPGYNTHLVVTDHGCISISWWAN